MSKLLEEKVKDLIEKEKLKKSANQAEYLADKNYWKTYYEVMSLLESGHKLANDSEYFAKLKRVKYGRVDLSYVLKLVAGQYPHLVEQYKNKCRRRVVERVEYGKKKSK